MTNNDIHYIKHIKIICHISRQGISFSIVDLLLLYLKERLANCHNSPLRITSF